MTREEAIRILKNFSLCGVYHQLIHMNDTDSEAISMAIKALEAPEPSAQQCEYWDSESNYCALNRPSAQPEPCEDAVSRQVAIDTLIKWMRPICINNLGEVVESDDMVAIRNILKSLPSVQPERPRGEWINRSLNIIYPDWERYTCSACGKHAYNYDFCPNCGADMRGKRDDSISD